MGVKDLDKIILSTLFGKIAQTSVLVWFHLGKVQDTPHFESVGCNEQRDGEKEKEKFRFDQLCYMNIRTLYLT